MTNPYFDHPASATRYVNFDVPTGDDFNNTFDSISTGFDEVYTAILALTDGSAIGIPYTFSTTTTDADPGDGILRLDNATQNAATTIRADLLGSDGATWTDVLATFDDSTSTVKGHILLQKLADASKWLLFSVSALASPSGYKNITVANVAGSATSPFTNGDEIVLKFNRTGDKGDTGDTGPAANPNATQTEMEAASSNTTIATPGNINWHPGAAKAWLQCDAAGTIDVSHNITSITDNGTGDLTVTLATDFSSANYVAVVACEISANARFANVSSKAAGSAVFKCYTTAEALTDPTKWNIAFFGDQA